MPVLLIEKGKNKGSSLDCSGVNNIVVGRGTDSLLIINDPAVSRNHFKIYLKNDKYYIEDCGSLNGTMLNGKFIPDAININFGDQIRIGENIIS